jgi:membrane-associated phospholipid phosphatase
MSKIERFVLYPLLAVCFVLFAFYDLPIMEHLYDESNLFGRLGENLGEMPFQLLAVYCAGLLFKFRPKNKKSLNILFAILGVVLILVFAGYGGGMIYSYLKRPVYGFGAHLWLAAVVASIYLLAGVLLVILTKTDHPERAFSFAVFVIISYVAILASMNLFKVIWARPRWRYLLAESNGNVSLAETYFVPWYLPHSADRLPGSTFDDYASFPSGHTMNALGIVFLSLTPSFLPVYKNKGLLLRICAYVWAGFVALSRTIMGAHFSSDVTAGFFLTLLLFDLTSTFFYPWWTSFIAKRYEKPLEETPQEA